MKKDKSTPTKLSNVVINHRLDKLAKKDLFPKKLKEANKILSTTPLPKIKEPSR
ncbi:MAG: hypothetical protein ACK5BV_09415 [Bacteroidota bacterium]|jgi:hypothetical protein